MSIPSIQEIDFGPSGLLPAVVQSPGGEVRMLGYVNAESLAITLDSGWVTFWSRSRQKLWTKGESSGNKLRLLDAFLDCDGDTLLLVAEPQGPTCHRGTPSCFDGGAALPWLERLQTLLCGRKAGEGAEGSYTRKLFARGPERIGKKVVEEAGEVAIAAMANRYEPGPARREDLLNEAADLLFHLQVLLVDQGLGLEDLAGALQARHK